MLQEPTRLPLHTRNNTPFHLLLGYTIRLYKIKLDTCNNLFQENTNKSLFKQPIRKILTNGPFNYLQPPLQLNTIYHTLTTQT